jgi:hypothetical protein
VSKSMQNTNLHAQKQSLPYLGDFKKVWVWSFELPYYCSQVHSKFSKAFPQMRVNFQCSHSQLYSQSVLTDSYIIKAFPQTVIFSKHSHRQCYILKAFPQTMLYSQSVPTNNVLFSKSSHKQCYILKAFPHSMLNSQSIPTDSYILKAFPQTKLY